VRLVLAIEGDGSFRFGHIARGAYVVQVLAEPTDPPAGWC